MWVSITWELRQLPGPHPKPGVQEVWGSGQESPGEADAADPRASVSAGEREASPKPERNSAATAQRAQTTRQLLVILLKTQRVALPGTRSSARRCLPHC